MAASDQTGKNPGYRSFDGADGEVRIPDGEWYINTKARARRMMANSLSSDARRVYECLELATMGWKQELAITMDGGKTRPLTPGDIAKQTGLLRQHVTAGLAELERAGLVLRKAPDGGALRKGNVLIYSWAVPRQPKEEDCNRAQLQFPSWFPDSWEPIRPFITRLRLNLVEDNGTARGSIEPVAEAARRYKEAEIELTRALEPFCARPKRESASLYTKNVKILRERTHPTARPVLPEASAPEPIPVEPELTEKPVGWSEGELNINGSAKAQVEKHLAKFDVSSPLTPETVAVVAESLPTQELIDHFIEATAGDKPRSWGFFIKKAPKIVEDHPRYMAAKAAAENGSPPGKALTREEQKVEAWLRRREAQGK